QDDRLERLRDLDGRRQRDGVRRGGPRRRGGGAAPGPCFLGRRERRCGVRVADRRIVDLARRDGKGRERERGSLGRRRRRAGGAADRDERDRGLTRGVDVEQRIHVGIDEAGDDPRREPDAGGEAEEVREQRAAVPEGVPVRPRLVLPRVPPVGRRADERRGRLRDRRLATGRGDERAAVI